MRYVQSTTNILKIILENIGKKFNREWIFRGLSQQLEGNFRCAVIGGNGSGKSTLLQIISGYLSPSEGVAHWEKDGQKISRENIYQHVTWCTPMLSLYDEFTLLENVNFYLQFKKLQQGINANDFTETIGLHKQKNKQLRYFSSGMRQRVKLGLAILGDSSILLLDEPTSHLDANAVKWYKDLLEKNVEHRSIFIASNSQPDEIEMCRHQIIVENYKGAH